MSMIQRFLRDGTPAGVLKVVDGEWNAGTDGTDSISLTVIGELNKGDFIMWADDDGDLHEHEISESSVSHTSGLALVNATGINSVSELYGFQLPGLAELDQPVRMQVSNFMEAELGGDPSSEDNDSHWVWGDNGTYGFSVASEYFVVSFEEKESLRSALAKIATYLGAEMRAVLTKENGEYVRTIYMYRPMSNEAIYVDPVKRFTFGKNIDGIKRDIAGDTLYSAVHAYGAAIKDADGNETGARYECYAWGTDAQKNAYGYRGADGNMHHSVAIYENSDIDNLTDLQAEANRYLDYVSQPQVTYTCDIANVEGVKLGDYVDIIDEGFTPELRKRARVTSIKQKILAPTRSGTVVIGKKKDEFTSSIVKAHEASKSDPNSDAHEEASTVSKLDDQVNDTETGLATRTTDLENRNATLSQTGFVKPDGTTTTVDADGTMHASGGGSKHIQRTVEVMIDSLDGMSGTTGSIPIYGTKGFYFDIPLTNLARQLSISDFDYHNYYDAQTETIKPMPFAVTSVNVGMQERSGSLVNVGIHYDIGYLPQIDDLVLWVKLYELNVSSTIYSVQVTDLRNQSFDIQISQESKLASYAPVVNVNWSNIKHNSNT